MRHSIKDRQINFSDKADRPYDLPINDRKLPLEQLKEMKTKVRNLCIAKIISSPFRRCIQTSVIIAKELNIDTIQVDSRIGETGIAVFREFDEDPKEVAYYSKGKLEREHEIKIEWMDKEHKPIWDTTGENPTNDHGLNKNDRQYDDFKQKEFPKLFDLKHGDTLIVAHAVPCNQWSGKKYWVNECGWIAVVQKNGKMEEIACSTRCKPR